MERGFGGERVYAIMIALLRSGFLFPETNFEMWRQTFVLFGYTKPFVVTHVGALCLHCSFQFLLIYLFRSLGHDPSTRRSHLRFLLDFLLKCYYSYLISAKD